MAAQKDQGSKIRATDRYRVVVYDDDTLGEVKSANVTKAGIIAGLLAFFLISSLLTALLISFTPLRYLVPGYADITNNKVYMDIQGRLATMEKELDAQRTYTNGIKKFLNPTGAKLSQSDLVSGETKLNEKNEKQKVSLDHHHFHSPLHGEVSAGFDKGKKHFGIDIVAEKDSPVRSILDGVVISSDWSVKTGNTISIQHQNEIISVYKHNAKLLKNIGERVNGGEAIAIIGNTGLHSSGPHVHFELWSNGTPVDPLTYIHLN